MQRKNWRLTMKSVFPEPIQNLPRADIPLDGLRACLSQADSHQILFMEFEEEVDLPEHSHEAQIGFVLEGKIELTIGGDKRT
jgi:quercetin dioxygenase-like cupin family protein